MAKYLVTGGCGFIGSHLVEQLLLHDHEVRVLDNLSTGKCSNIPEEVELVQGDINDLETVEACMRGVDGCFHLAAIASVEKSNEEWLDTHRVNLTSTINIFSAAKTASCGKPIPVVYASSAAIYGHTGGQALTEDASKAPLSAYGVDKYACELHARIATQVHHVPTIGARFFNVYGPRQDPNSPYSGVISLFFAQISEGAAIRIYGDGEQSRDFIYVTDVVCFLELAMLKLRQQTIVHAEVYNVCTQQSTKINTLAQKVGLSLGFSVAIEHYPARKGDIRYSLGNGEKAYNALKFKANTPLLNGLKKMVAYFESIDAETISA